jgi:hypothetical protein
MIKVVLSRSYLSQKLPRSMTDELVRGCRNEAAYMSRVHEIFRLRSVNIVARTAGPTVEVHTIAVDHVFDTMPFPIFVIL